VRKVLAAGFLLLIVAIPSFGGAADTPSLETTGGPAVNPDSAKSANAPGSAVVPPAPAAEGVPAVVPLAAVPGGRPVPAASVPPQNPIPPAAPSPAFVPSRLPPVPTVSLVAPPSE